jgi:integrase
MRFGTSALRDILLDRRGPSAKTVQTFAGHSSLQATMDRYGHLFRSDSRAQAMDAIASAIDSPTKPTAPQHAHRSWDFTPQR